MCGFVGVAGAEPWDHPETLTRMRDTLAHRGPDDSGMWFSDDRRVALAHRRLAVIDLSERAAQPMTDASGGLQVAYNGEIYNHRALRKELEAAGHRFRSSGDTEVLLEAYRAWGLDCLQRLNGMFSFALYDSGRDRLFLARDRAGEKPLFYRHRNGNLHFGSELKALLKDPTAPRKLNLEALNHYLAYGYVPGELCILEGFHKLGAGQAMTYEPGTDRVERWQYWNLPEPDLGAGGATASGSTRTVEDDLERRLEDLLRDSVRLRFEADVPVGVLLSGGLDSSLITAMAAEVSSAPVPTYTVSFPGHGSFDEAPYARLVADHFGTDHHELTAEASAVDLLPALAHQYDEPIADSSMIPTFLVSRLIRDHATVALGGDGGDEVLGGYPHYSWLQRKAAASRRIPRPLQKAMAAAAGATLPVGFKGRNYLVGLGAGEGRSVAHVNMYFDASARRRLVPALGWREAAFLSGPEDAKVALGAGRGSLLDQATAVDFQSYLVDDILVKVDRASMMASLELRCPWLDHRIVELAFSQVPSHLRATATERKVLARRLGRRLLPATLDLDRKQGFSLPLESWFSGPWGKTMETVLLDGAGGSGCFARPEIEKLIALQHRGYRNVHRIFALAMFELWRREYRVEVPD